VAALEGSRRHSATTLLLLDLSDVRRLAIALEADIATQHGLEVVGRRR
jgi:hypothetical protein